MSEVSKRRNAYLQKGNEKKVSREHSQHPQQAPLAVMKRQRYKGTLSFNRETDILVQRHFLSNKERDVLSVESSSSSSVKLNRTDYVLQLCK